VQNKPFLNPPFHSFLFLSILPFSFFKTLMTPQREPSTHLRITRIEKQAKKKQKSKFQGLWTFFSEFFASILLLHFPLFFSKKIAKIFLTPTYLINSATYKREWESVEVAKKNNKKKKIVSTLLPQSQASGRLARSWKGGSREGRARLSFSLFCFNIFFWRKERKKKKKNETETGKKEKE